MGVTIQAESHRVELAGLYEYEHDRRVLEFYDQPPSIKLVYQAKWPASERLAHARLLCASRRRNWLGGVED